MLKLSALEVKLFEAPEIDLAWGALIASGAKTQRELDSYLGKIDSLCRQLEVEIAEGDDLRKARAIFDWLWWKKAGRYEYRGSFRLTEVIDAQLQPGAEKVGNCLGLTVIYNALAQKLGLKTEAVHLEEAFDIGPHVFSVLHTSRGTIDIENIFPHGFDFKEHLDNPQRTRWGDAELIADIYHSVGNEFFDRGELEEATRSYGKAIWLNPKYAKAYLNRGIALSRLGRDEEARQDLNSPPN